jgi:hypothetical protein
MGMVRHGAGGLRSTRVRSLNRIQTKCNWVNRPLRKPLKTRGFENASYRPNASPQARFIERGCRREDEVPVNGSPFFGNDG